MLFGTVVEVYEVASLAEAWIETAIVFRLATSCSSPPSRRRGLKQMLAKIESGSALSPPSRRRGLKQNLT